MPAARADEKTARSGEKTREPASAVTDMKPPASSVPGTRVEAPKVARPAPSDVRTDANKRPTSRSPIPSGRAADAADAIRGGEYFVQVGAFKDREAARRLVSTLRAQNYRVDESVLHGDGVPAPAGPRAATAARSDRYELIVSGASSADINTKLAAKGLVSEAAGDNVRIRPTLSLRDAVALSKDLNTEGLKVQMRRGNGAPADALVRAAAPAPGAREARYRVRVGGYPDRASALLAVRELERKGYTPFIARGRDEGR
jgi:hypothetical protein